MRRITALSLRLLTDLARGGYGERPELDYLTPSCAASVHGALAAIGGDGWYVETDYGEAVAGTADLDGERWDGARRAPRRRPLPGPRARRSADRAPTGALAADAGAGHAMHPHHRAPGRGRVSTGPHARWFRARLAGAGIIDMGAGEHASRVWRSRRVRRARATALAAGAVLALGCATAGVVLSILPTGVSVADDGDHLSHRRCHAPRGRARRLLRFGDPGARPPRPGPHRRRIRGRQRRALGRVLRGRRGRGGGDVPPAERDADADRTRRVVRGHWQRTYSDGVRVEIAAARGVPVPFPVGR